MSAVAWIACSSPALPPEPVPPILIPRCVRAELAPLLGDAAALVERVEFHPVRRGSRPAGADRSQQRTDAHPAVVATRHRDGRRFGRPGHRACPFLQEQRVRQRRPRRGPQVIVMDIPKIVEEARRAAADAGVAAADPKIRAMIDQKIEAQLERQSAGAQGDGGAR